MAEHNIHWPGWETVDQIGKGGFGVVYEIRREYFDDVERRAIKVITLPKDSEEISFMRSGGMDDLSISNALKEQIEDFYREYKVMRTLHDNPNIVHCDDFRYSKHQDDPGWDIYICMELLTPLLNVLDKVSSESDIIRMGIELCNALEACHNVGIIHRDIKPQNIFLSPKGIFKLGDFGIARKMEHSTRATGNVGTYSYMAPEVASNQKYGKTIDIYSLGLVLYWLLNEKRQPFLPMPPQALKYSDMEHARQRRYSGEAIPAPRNGSPGLKAVVLKACAFDPRDRYQSAAEMKQALEQLQTQSSPSPTIITHAAHVDISAEERTVLDHGTSSTNTPKPRGFEEEKSIPHTHCAPDRPTGGTVSPSKSGKLPKWGMAVIVLLVAAIVGLVGTNGTPSSGNVTPPSIEQTTAPSPETVPTVSAAWKDNILMQDMLPEICDKTETYLVLGSDIPREAIIDVTFLDTVANAPASSWDVSAAGNGNVLAWVSNTGSLFIAAEGGINGANACNGLFYEYKNLTSINFNNCFHTEEALSMANMFSGCGNLRELHIESFDTSSVTDMTNMFYYCKSLTGLDVGGFDTANVTSMSGMFRYCFELASLDVASFNTSRVEDLSGMFAGCHALTYLDLSSFDTSQVTNMASVFDSCSNLAAVELAGFDTSKVTSMNYLFFGCQKLTALGLSSWDTSSVTDMNSLFAKCSALTSLDISTWNTSNVVNMEQMFWQCGKFSFLDLRNFDTSNVQNFACMFLDCGNLTALDIGSFDTGNAIAMNQMFKGCSSLPTVNLRNFNTSNVTSMSEMFSGCSSLSDLDVSSFDTSLVTNMEKMFYECSSLYRLDVGNFDTSKVHNMVGMFEKCPYLTVANVASFDTSSVELYGSFMDKDKLINGHPWKELFQSGALAADASETGAIPAVAKTYSAVDGGADHTVILYSDGTVDAIGRNQYGQCDVHDWENVIQISTLRNHTVGLKADGTVYAAGNNSDGQCDVDSWTDIIAISAGDHHTVGVKSDGTVVTAGKNQSGECDLDDWTDIVAVGTAFTNTFGLCSDGTVIAAGSYTNGKIAGWTDIEQISVSDSHIVGLCPDGTVKAAGSNNHKQCKVSDWKDIVQVSAGCAYTVGLKEDGTILVQGIDDVGQHDAKKWKNVEYIATGLEHTIGIKKDGTFLAVGGNDYGQRDVSIFCD